MLKGTMPQQNNFNIFDTLQVKLQLPIILCTITPCFYHPERPGGDTPSPRPWYSRIVPFAPGTSHGQDSNQTLHRVCLHGHELTHHATEPLRTRTCALGAFNFLLWGCWPSKFTVPHKDWTHNLRLSEQPSNNLSYGARDTRTVVLTAFQPFLWMAAFKIHWVA